MVSNVRQDSSRFSCNLKSGQVIKVLFKNRIKTGQNGNERRASNELWKL